MSDIITLNNSPDNIYAFEAYNMKEAVLKVHDEVMNNPSCQGAVWVRGQGDENQPDMKSLREAFYEANGERLGLIYRPFERFRNNADNIEVYGAIEKSDPILYRDGKIELDNAIIRDIALEEIGNADELVSNPEKRRAYFEAIHRVRTEEKERQLIENRVKIDTGFMPATSVKDLENLAFICDKARLTYRFHVQDIPVLSHLMNITKPVSSLFEGKGFHLYVPDYSPHFDGGEEPEALDETLILGGRAPRILIPREMGRTSLYETKDKELKTRPSRGGLNINKRSQLGKAWDVAYGDVAFILPLSFGGQATPHSSPKGTLKDYALRVPRGLENYWFEGNMKPIEELRKRVQYEHNVRRLTPPSMRHELGF